MSRISSLAGNTLAYALGFALARGFTFLLLPIYTNLLSPQEYGILALLGVLIAVSGNLFNLGFLGSFERFFLAAENSLEQKAVFSTSLVCLLFSSLFFCAVYFVASAPLSEFLFGGPGFANLIVLTGITVALDQFLQIQLLVLRSNFKAFSYAAMIILNSALILVLSGFFVGYLKLGITGAALAAPISSLVTSLFLLAFTSTFWKFEFRKDYAKRMLFFGMPFIPIGILLAVVDGIDRCILKYFSGLEVVGEYSAGYRLGFVMLYAVLAFNSIWSPYALRIRTKEVSNLTFPNVANLFASASGLLFLLMFCVLPYVPDLHFLDKPFIGKTYVSGLIVVPFIVLSFILFGFFHIFVSALELSNMTRPLIPIAIAAAAANVVGNLILIPLLRIKIQHGAMIAAAVSTVLAYAVLAAMTLYFSQKHYPIPYDWKRIGGIAALITAFAIILHKAPLVLQLAGIPAYVILLFALKIISPQDFGFRRPAEAKPEQVVF